MYDSALAAAEKRIAELEQQLRRAKVEMEVRLNQPVHEAPCFRKGWVGLHSTCVAEGIGHHAAGKAAVEAAIAEKMEGGNGTS